MHSRLFLAGIFSLALAAQPLLGQDAAPSAAGQSAASEAQPGAHPRQPLPKPVNLKVLSKDLSREDLIKIMRGYAGALGVECKFCHATNPQTHKLDFASDARDDKTIARTMIAMTRTINDQYMSQVHDPDAMPEDKHVTCGTCHRGHSMPEHFVPPPGHQHPSQGAEPARQPQ
jgi:Photosynthetic reaction centre cytochrome C subunit